MNRMMSLMLLAALLAAAGAGAWLTKDRWGRVVWPEEKDEGKKSEEGHAQGDRVKLTPQARKNLGLSVGPAELRKEHWRTTAIPGSVVDRPGLSDRGVATPITGVVSRIHAFPSDTVKPGAALFTVRITSELVQNAQAELFKATRERELNEAVLKKLVEAGGAVAAVRVTEARNQQAKIDAQVRSQRQILQSLGLTAAQLDAAAAGGFVRETTAYAPPGDGDDYEVKDLKAQPGEQVQAGQVLATLADHRQLYIEGRAFKSEAALLARAAEEAWPVGAEFAEDDARAWPTLEQTLAVRHLANSMDPSSRTFAFYVPLANQSRPYRREGRTYLVWRFRPGQRVRLNIRSEPLKDVIVVPTAAVVREGPEAYVFRANGDAFDRKPVTVLHEDRREAVLANDGSIAPGVFIALNAAAALNRVLAAQKAGEGGGDSHAGHSH
ncbi:MAG: efflux RND transporter periplasmic adaptor subunit [Gemmataceae bacterium]|nr:efflux RND transporter periplasmic adaptor subunit [Gemmataceae bacterium]